MARGTDQQQLNHKPFMPPLRVLNSTARFRIMAGQYPAPPYGPHAPIRAKVLHIRGNLMCFQCTRNLASSCLRDWRADR